MKLLALSISRWKHSDASIKEPVHLSYAVELSQFSFFQRGTVKEITALVLRTCVSKTNPGDYQVWQAAAPCCWRGRTRWSLPGAWTGAWSRAPSRRQGGAVAATCATTVNGAKLVGNSTCRSAGLSSRGALQLVVGRPRQASE
jgi:hypothetical protein